MGLYRAPLCHLFFNISLRWKVIETVWSIFLGVDGNALESLSTVLNNVEVNDNVEGEYLPQIYEKFMLGVQTFAEEYNSKFPYKPLKQITVGMHLNDLDGELREHNKKSKVLLKAIDYSIYCPPDELYEGDSNDEQYVVWSANQKNKNSQAKNNPDYQIEK